MSKTVLITGSSTGIGRATAIKFQQEGWNVIATMRNPEKEQELGSLENVIVTRLDVQDQDTIDRTIETGLSNFGSIDVVVNNAGYGLAGTFESISRESIQRQFGVNVFGLFDVTRAILPHFRKQKSGVIINITSVGGVMTFPLFSMYHATKFAVEGFSESLQYEVESLGIRVKIVEPGGVSTDFATRSLDFQHDESLTDYNAFVSNIMNAFQERLGTENQSTPAYIADIIFTAATDGKPTIRYRAGVDAEQMLSARKQMDDASFIGMLKSQFGI